VIPVANLEEDFQATSDALLRDLEQIREMEEQKRLLDVRDPRVAELSARIEELTRRTHVKSKAESQIVAELQQTPGPERAG
jgi:hypothetical protein